MSSQTIDAELVEQLRIPSLVLDGEHVQVLVLSVDEVNPAAESASHVVALHSEAGPR